MSQSTRNVPTNADNVVLPLPFDYTRTEGARLADGICSVKLPMRDLGQEVGDRFASLCLTAFQVLLYRYTGEQTITVGLILDHGGTDVLTAPASAAKADNLGFSGNTSCRELLQRSDWLLSQAESIRRDACAAHQTAFVVRRLPPVPCGEASAAVDYIWDRNLVCDIALELHDTGEACTASLRYRTDLFRQETIERMADHFIHILNGIEANPEQLLGQLNLLSDSEKALLVKELNDTEVPFPSDTAFHHLFEAQVERTPTATALHFEGRQQTYQALNHCANQLAHYLRRLGVGPGVLVGLCCEPSLEMITGILGVWKAGGAYVPLDPAYPKERLEYMVRDAQVRLLLTQSRVAGQLPEHGAHTVLLDVDWPRIAQQPSANLPPSASPDDLAYVIYTSGSTGRPKGVQLEHRGLCNLAEAQSRTFKITPADRVLQFASISFDASVFEIVMALRNGAALFLAHRSELMPGPDLVRTLRDNQISMITMPPSALAALPSAELPDLRTIVAAGEACPASLVEKWAPGRQFFNAYGPTEATVWTTAALCDNRTDRPPIGRPIANVQVYLLDRDRNLVPMGVPGELYIGGCGIARGYLGRPDLTAEHFVPDPFAQTNGRLYKTGDLCRYLPDGNIEFLGRIDHQVKVRGFRIDPAEVEAALNRCPSLEESVVVGREIRPGEVGLVAYVVTKGPRPSVRDLREDLYAHLPAYMIPSAFVFLDALPLSPNGKINRKALPAPNTYDLADSTEYAGPSTPLEASLCNIWEELLGVDRVGIHDNFMVLGGHSLLATQVMARIRADIGVNLPLSSLFEHPTIADLSKAMSAALQGGAGDAQRNQIRPVPRHDRMPLSPSQERIWFLQQLDPQDMSYNAQATLRFKGNLDLSALERSLSEVVRRHEIWRTTFPSVGGEPIQRIHPPCSIQLTMVDISAAPEAEKEAELERQIREEFGRQFQLDQLPLVRWKLFRLNEREHVLSHVEHHLVHDGWSFTVFIRELQASYNAFSSGRLPGLEEPAIQFADFAAWQRSWVESEEAAAQLSYWKDKLADCPPVLQLPIDRQRPPVQTHRGKVVRFDLPADLSNAVRAFSQAENSTLFMSMLTAFYTLLHRYSRQDDICVGCGIANRQLSETENLMGMIINTLVFRTDVSGDPTFRELLRRVRTTTLDAYSHQDLPFGKVVEALQPQRHLSHNPLFQVMFNFHDAPMPEIAFPGLEVTLFEGISNDSAKFDINVIIIPRAEQNRGHGHSGELTVLWECNTDLFDEATIARMVEHYQMVLRAMVDNPDQPVSEPALLTGEERRLLLSEWNGAESEYPVSQCLHQWFEAQVEQTPQAVAIVFEEARLTYAELNMQANQVAHYLLKCGVGPDVPVGLCVERSLEMVVGILGILKAGGAYVPLDPSYPADRLAFMLQDTQAPVVLTQERSLAHLPETDALVVALDRDWAEISLESKANPVAGSQPGNLAYIIYTSGSTGRPKGVEVEHRSVVRLMLATESWYGFNASDVWTLFHSYAFDFSVWELWGALLYGGRLVVVPYLVSRSPEVFYELLCTEKVTVLNQTPSSFRNLIRAEESVGVSPELSLRLVIFGGEALELPTLRPWFERHGDQQPQLVNMYGITETTVHVTYRPITMQDVLTGRGSVIGCPIRDLAVYALDDRLQPVPIGVPGELFVGGAGLARGYLNRPELTQERFIPHPFGGKSGSRLYRSGDLVRFLSNGDLEYLGRADQQVKIRGFRIELGEIESVLLESPGIREAVVRAQADASGNRQLVAYVVPTQPQSAPAPGDLRAFARTRLPSYMVPAFFVTLDALPLTSNGKIDYRALPQPSDLHQPARNINPPRTPEEKVLARIWVEVLGVEEIGIDDNFFDVGGDSIRTIQVQAKAAASGLGFTIQQLFEHQTIAALCEALQRGEQYTPSEGQTGPFSLLNDRDRAHLPANVEDAYPLTTLQAGMVFHSELDPDSAVYNTFHSYRLAAPLDVDALRLTLNELAERHPLLRASLDLAAYSEPLQIIHQTADMPLEVHDLRTLSADEQVQWLDHWLGQEKHHRYDWTVPPLARCYVHRRSDDTFQFTLSCHHAIIDGWSVASLLTELLQLYFRRIMGHAAVPAEPRALYREYVAQEREALASEAHREFWGRKLKECSPTVLPTLPVVDRSGREQIEVRNVALPEDLSVSLRRLARTIAVPLKNVLLAAHLRVLQCLTGQQDVTTGLVSHGRLEKAGGDQVVGLHLNTLPFRLQLDGGTWLDLCQKTFRAEQECLPHRRYPLARVQQDHGGTALFDTSFNFTNFHVFRGIREIEGLKVLEVSGYNETNFTLVTQFSVDPATGSIYLRLTTQAALLDTDRVEAIAGYYMQTLTEMAQNPAGRYELTCPLSPFDMQQWERWSRSDTAAPASPHVHQLIQAQAEQHPNAPALVCEDESLTYQELNSRANQLAHYLRSLGVQSESVVGLYLERSVDMVTAILGVLKAGGAYLPLDPALPAQRTAHLLQDAGVRIVISRRAMTASVPSSYAVICLDGEQTQIRRQSTANLDAISSTEALAYVIYTSGSTGRPKGVAVEHRQLANYVSGITQRLGLGPGETYAIVSTFAADLGHTVLFPALCTGGTLHVIAEARVFDPEAYAAYCRNHRIDCLKIVPSHLKALLSATDPHHVVPRRRLILGGEATPPALLETVRMLAPSCTVFNHYGPTETTVGVLTLQVEPERLHEGASSLPLGRPLPGVRVYLLDAHLNPVPVGVPGEIYIGGASVSRGYLHQPDLTAERFLPDPFSDLPGGRMYRTGDLGRFLPGGNVEFLGRSDDQVKIRGFRVETAEVEAVVRQHPAVREAVVVACEDAVGEKRLVAYLVLAGGTTASPAEIRAFIQDRLPHYMVPTIVVLEALPLTPNGKVDRRSLPTPDWGEPKAGRVFISPRTDAEEVVAGLCEDVLGIDRISIDDNLFELGAHSLLATQIVSRVRKLLQVDVPLRLLFAAPTVASFVSALSEDADQGRYIERMAGLVLELTRMPDSEVAVALDADAATDD